MNATDNATVEKLVLGDSTPKPTSTNELILRSSDIDNAIDQILLGILKELPYYSPIHRAIRKPLEELLKKAGVGDPGGDGTKNNPPEDPHP